MIHIRLAISAFSFAAFLNAQIVALDGFHNDETKLPDHYRWEGTNPGGFSELGKTITGLGGTLRTIHQRVTEDVLVDARVFIVVDPDTPAESANPKYFETEEINAIESWVRRGGRLVLLGNDKGNAEFQHFNQLAGRFGIQFVEDTYPKVKGKGILVVKGSGSIFDHGLTVYLVEIAPLTLTANAKPLLEDNGTAIMALATVGKGKVFALGDPWVYNEYIDREDNRKIAFSLFRVLLSEK